jgi:chromatin segregation and condensation protein Rec8/ScpA/Scc1 (kleisin family)
LWWAVLELHKHDVITIEQHTFFDYITRGRSQAFGAVIGAGIMPIWYNLW